MMKRTNFLKVFFAAIMMIAMVGVYSCKDEKPACETRHTGTVVIYNDFPGVIEVDVYAGDDFLGERVLGIGQSTTYKDVPAGDVEIWEADAYSDWGYWLADVDQCGTLEFTIYQGKGLQHIADFPLDIDQKLRDKKKE